MGIPNTTAILPVEDLWVLPVVENATNLASATSSRPTNCPAKVPKLCDRGPSAEFPGIEIRRANKEWDRCSCGIWLTHIPGPKCSYPINPDRPAWRGNDNFEVRPTPYWGTGYDGCYCWCRF